MPKARFRIPRVRKKDSQAVDREIEQEFAAFSREQGELGLLGEEMAIKALSKGMTLPEIPCLSSGNLDYSKYLGIDLNGTTSIHRFLL